MDKKSKILLIIVTVISVVSISLTFYMTVFKGGFVSRYDTPVRE